VAADVRDAYTQPGVYGPAIALDPVKPRGHLKGIIHIGVWYALAYDYPAFRYVTVPWLKLLNDTLY
jgi:hypothetical protein